MKKIDRILSLLLVLLMMAAAAICVNKTIFGHEITDRQKVSTLTATPSDSITMLADGTAVVHTASLSNTKEGYAGPVPLDIYIKDGKIIKIKPLENDETPTFFNRALALLEKWKGMTVAEALDAMVDAVSGATYSSSAIINNARKGFAAYIGASAKEGNDIPWKIWLALGVTLSACVVPLFLHSKVYHQIQLIANVIVLGFWCGEFLDYTNMLRFISDGISLPVGITAILMLIAAFIYPLFGHPEHYCNNICPLGSAQMLVASVSRYKVKIPAKLLHGLDWFRRILWAFLMLALWTDIWADWMNLELFQAFQVESAPWYIMVAAAVFILLSAIISRPYCRFICPSGSLFKRGENFG